jgi:predicted DNA-binding protein (UPF0251 family)
MHTRGRPKKYRFIRQDPKKSQFSPRGRPGRPDEVSLATEELEAIRLTDHMGFCQKEAAKSMKVSQQTFSRILRKARKTVANGLVRGTTIKIQGGSYVVDTRGEY